MYGDNVIAVNGTSPLIVTTVDWSNGRLYSPTTLPADKPNLSKVTVELYVYLSFFTLLFQSRDAMTKRTFDVQLHRYFFIFFENFNYLYLAIFNDAILTLL